MGKSKKYIIYAIVFLYVLCAIVKDIEFLYIKTDSTFIGENVICKIVCIVATVFLTYKLGYKLSDIGFKNRNVLKYAVYGLGLGMITFAISYGVELLILSLSGQAPRLSVYISNFGLTGATNTMSLTFTAVVICIIGNIINVLAEEGLFRGIMLKTISDRWGFKRGNFVQGLLFGLWHVISCVQGVKEGVMTIGVAIVFAIGYIILAGILAIEWGTCVNMTGVLWVGMFEHFFNNFISNALHVLSIGSGGIVEADNMQIVRIILSNVLSLTIVLFVKSKRTHTN